ncbi:hypothetical protein ACA910_006426 [Epithemia clementina (nom. ined.)]
MNKKRGAWQLRLQQESSATCTKYDTPFPHHNPDSVWAWVFWGVFKTQDVMQEYMDAQFQDHPSVSSEYIKFLAVNSGTENVKILEDKFQVLQDKQAWVMEQLKKATSKADSASNLVNTQKRKSKNSSRQFVN